MGMSTWVMGFIPPDAKWNQMREVYNACRSAKVPVPKEVDEFFYGVDPNDSLGREVEIKEAVREYTAEAVDGREVDLSKLPPEVKFVRFYNGW